MNITSILSTNGGHRRADLFNAWVGYYLGGDEDDGCCAIGCIKSQVESTLHQSTSCVLRDDYLLYYKQQGSHFGSDKFIYTYSLAKNIYFTTGYKPGELLVISFRND